MAWAVRYLAQNTDGPAAILVERPGTLRPVEVLGAAWLDAVRRALGRETYSDIEAVVEQVSQAVELELLGGQALGGGWEELAESSEDGVGGWGRRDGVVSGSP